MNLNLLPCQTWRPSSCNLNVILTNDRTFVFFGNQLGLFPIFFYSFCNLGNFDSNNKHASAVSLLLCRNEISKITEVSFVLGNCCSRNIPEFVNPFYFWTRYGPGHDTVQNLSDRDQIFRSPSHHFPERIGKINLSIIIQVILGSHTISQFMNG